MDTQSVCVHDRTASDSTAEVLYPTSDYYDASETTDFSIYDARKGQPVYKYRDYKMHFIQLESMYGAPQRLNMPQMYHLIKDPKELYPLDKVDVADAWFMAPVTKRVVAFQRTLALEPPIRLGTPDPYLPRK